MVRPHFITSKILKKGEQKYGPESRGEMKPGMTCAGKDQQQFIQPNKEWSTVS
jgi:hypothetical protein